MNDLNKLLQTLNKNHAELEISWNSPQNENEKWKGTKDRIQNLSIQLSELVTQEMPTVTLEAEVYALSKGGRLELKPRGQKRVVVYYSINLYEKIQRLSIGEYRTFSIKPFVSSNAASGITKESYQLIEIN